MSSKKAAGPRKPPPRSTRSSKRSSGKRTPEQVKEVVWAAVWTLLKRLEEKHRRETGDTVDPYYLALVETMDFTREVYAKAKLMWEAAVMVPPLDPRQRSARQTAIKWADAQRCRTHR